MYEYVQNNQIADLTSYMNANNYKNRFLDASIAQSTYQGKIWAVPVTNVSVCMVFYDKDIFAKYNLSVPTTIREMEAVCDTLKANGITPFSLANLTQWTGSMYFMFFATRHGGVQPFINGVDGSGSLTDPAFIYAGDKIQEWVNKGYFLPGFNGLDWDSGQARAPLYRGETAMLIMGSWFIGQAQSESPEFYQRMVMFQFPRDEQGSGNPNTVIGTVGDNFFEEEKRENKGVNVDNEARIKELISKMTLKEKVSQLSHSSVAIPHLGIPEYNWWNECLHGVARAGVATVFPQAIALAATFDDGLVREVADAISDEARAKYNEAVKRGNRSQYWGLTFWTPNINIFRDPRWGRGQESYGEDPFLTSRIGVAFVQGLQGDDGENMKAAACAKHFAVHSGPEKLRHTFDAVVSKKDLFETYLPAFKALVDAGVESVMGAYNRTFGEPCCGSEYLLKGILRGKWGFKGHVVSDCWAIRDFHEFHKVTKTPEESAAMALNAGCDLNCGCTYPMLTLSCKEGLTSEEAIDTALARLLRTRLKLGMFDPPEKSKYGKLGHSVINCEKHRQLALKAAEKSIVLLKNDKGLLPLGNSARRITLVGPSAANPLALFGNYYGISPKFVTFLEGLGAKIQDKYAISLEYRPGCLQYRENCHSQFGSQTGFFTGAETDLIIAVMGLDGCIEGEESDSIASDSNGDRDTIELPPWQLEYLYLLKDYGKPVILVLTGGSPIAIPPDIADAVIFAWYPGEQGGKAVADIIFGDVIPSGKLPITFPASTGQLPPFEDYSMKGRTYRYMTEKPLYPFGFGLSYTSFRFDSIALSPDEISTEEILAGEISSGSSVKATVQFTNTGKRDADEVVQIYISKDERGVDDPQCSLRDFRRVFIQAGKSATVEFALPAAAFETVNAEGESVLVKGPYSVIASDAAPTPVSVEKGAPSPVSAKIMVK